eukprot:scaffold56166_cov64-Phaeocystis_antarctica.AAC.1
MQTVRATSALLRAAFRDENNGEPPRPPVALPPPRARPRDCAPRPPRPRPELPLPRGDCALVSRGGGSGPAASRATSRQTTLLTRGESSRDAGLERGDSSRGAGLRHGRRAKVATDSEANCSMTVSEPRNCAKSTRFP